VIAISIPIPLITIGWIAACVIIGLVAMAQGRSFVSWSLAAALATFRRKNEVCGCCGRIAQGMENCKVGRI